MARILPLSKGKKFSGLVGVWMCEILDPFASGGQSGPKLFPHVICSSYLPEKRTLNRTYFSRGSSANLPCLHTCENKVPFRDFSQFAVTIAVCQKRPMGNVCGVELFLNPFLEKLVLCRVLILYSIWYWGKLN